jgi:hypothetical protein
MFSINANGVYCTVYVNSTLGSYWSGMFRRLLQPSLLPIGWLFSNRTPTQRKKTRIRHHQKITSSMPIKCWSLINSLISLGWKKRDVRLFQHRFWGAPTILKNQSRLFNWAYCRYKKQQNQAKVISWYSPGKINKTHTYPPPPPPTSRQENKWGGGGAPGPWACGVKVIR